MFGLLLPNVGFVTLSTAILTVKEEKVLNEAIRSVIKLSNGLVPCIGHDDTGPFDLWQSSMPGLNNLNRASLDF